MLLQDDEHNRLLLQEKVIVEGVFVLIEVKYKFFVLLGFLIKN